jgi:hypothetical protein
LFAPVDGHVARATFGPGNQRVFVVRAAVRRPTTVALARFLPIPSVPPRRPSSGAIRSPRQTSMSDHDSTPDPRPEADPPVATSPTRRYARNIDCGGREGTTARTEARAARGGQESVARAGSRVEPPRR